MTGSRLLSPLGLRLAAAFVAVAIAAVAVLAGLTLVSATEEVSSLVTETHRQDARAAAEAAAQAYARAGGWDAADLSSASAVAARGQALLTVVDSSGRVLAAPASEAAEMMARMHGVEILRVDRDEPVERPVIVDGTTVGVVQLRFPTSHLPTPEREVRAALVRNAWIGVALAVASAIAVAVVVARLVSRPIEALTTAAGELGRGRRDVRVGLDDAPGELGTLSAAFDRMAEAVEEEDRLRRQLVADVAHELRTPLTILRGTTEALVDGVVRPDPATLTSLHDEVLRLTRLVSDLEVLAAADAAGLHLDSSPLDLADEAAAAVELAAPSIDANQLTVDLALERAPLVGDQHRIRQILTTVLANAIAYTPAGGTIVVRTRSEGQTSQLEILDTGPGVDAADLPHVFERFYRGVRTASTPGTGIGLSIARELVDAHRGTIRVENRARVGTAVTVTFPSSADR